MMGDHVSLYYHGFMRFKDSCKKFIPDKSDILLAVEMCWAMSQFYDDEPARLGAIGGVFKAHLPAHITVHLDGKVGVENATCDLLIALGYCRR